VGDGRVTGKDVDIDDIARGLQEMVDREESRVYSLQVRRERAFPQNMGRVGDPHGEATFTGSCGDTMEFSVRMNGDILEEVRFMTDGCGITVACGSMLSRTVEGRTVADVMQMSPGDLESLLGGLPESNRHCAALALETLWQAMEKTG